MRAIFFPLALVAIGAAVASTSRAAAPPLSPPLGSWAGRYDYAGGPDEQTARIRAIEQGTAGMGWLARRVARSRLDDELRPDPRLVVSVHGGAVGIGEQGNWRTALDGPPQTFREAGDAYRVRHTVSENRIVQTLVGEDVRIVRTHTLESGGARLRIDVVFTHGRLSGPIRYRLTYRRRGPTP